MLDQSPRMEVPMRQRLIIAAPGLLLGATAALAHHGWGSYDAAKKFTITAPVDHLMWQNPHTHVLLQHEGATWEITLAPISRMTRRGLSEDLLKPGTEIAAEGYPSTRNAHEMRAERITIAGTVYEMR
jgi:hypothetical protein